MTDTAKQGKQKPQKSARHWDAKLSHKVLHTIVTVVLTLAIIGGGAYAYLLFLQDTEVTIENKDVGSVKTVEALTPNNTRFTEAAFTFDMPGDWKKTGELTTGPFHKFSYQSTMKNAENRYLDIYLDKIPLDMAVNKVVAVRGEGTKLSHGSVSSNCAEFTMKTSAKMLVAPAKWDGVDFMCDMDVTTRNVVGTSSPGNINKVELTNVGFTKRQFFFVYTDHNFNPEYTIFYEVLDSFTVR